jgi:hypothetical protein
LNKWPAFFNNKLMSLRDRAKADIKDFTTRSHEWAVNILMQAPNSQTATFKGFTAKHHLGISSEGTIVNSQKVSVTFSEESLSDANTNYPIRNADGEVDLKNHLVSVADSTGITKQYAVQAWFPDETIGTITVILENYVS